MIVLKDIEVAYSKDYSALLGINLHVKKGEKIGIVGHKDSGKTALLRLIAGLEKQKSGEAYIKDTPIKKINFAKDVALGYLTNRAVFFERKSVYKNLAWTLKVHKVDKKEWQDRIQKVLEDFEITHLEKEKIHSLCESDRRLVQIARMALRPLEIILCDDVLTGDDSVTQEKIKTALKKLFKLPPKDKIIIMASEDEKIIKEFVTKIIHIDSGSFVEKQNEE